MAEKQPIVNKSLAEQLRDEKRKSLELQATTREYWDGIVDQADRGELGAFEDKQLYADIFRAYGVRARHHPEYFELYEGLDEQLRGKNGEPVLLIQRWMEYVDRKNGYKLHRAFSLGSISGGIVFAEINQKPALVIETSPAATLFEYFHGGLPLVVENVVLYGNRFKTKAGRPLGLLDFADSYRLGLGAPSMDIDAGKRAELLIGSDAIEKWLEGTQDESLSPILQKLSKKLS